jgi:hypothetical protein
MWRWPGFIPLTFYQAHEDVMRGLPVLGEGPFPAPLAAANRIKKPANVLTGILATFRGMVGMLFLGSGNLQFNRPLGQRERSAY